MDQQELPIVWMIGNVRLPRSSRLVAVRKRLFQQFTTLVKQSLAAIASKPSPVRMYGHTLCLLVTPLSSSRLPPPSPYCPSASDLSTYSARAPAFSSFSRTNVTYAPRGGQRRRMPSSRPAPVDWTVGRRPACYNLLGKQANWTVRFFELVVDCS